jgi:hypothetical protein
VVERLLNSDGHLMVQERDEHCQTNRVVP